MEARIVEMIRTVCTIGTGVDGDPVRTIACYWSKDGKLIAQININDDPYALLRQM
jgi:hypothetical protein